ncbi:MAG: hypothetical protein FWD13_02320 [Treponema sp.]|nr:hypothetical protein [Treponema sp.]
MTYYRVHSYQNYAFDRGIGTDVLVKEEGAVLPKREQFLENGNLVVNDFFSTYEEARAHFMNIYNSYRDNRAPSIDVKMHDEVTGEEFSYSG